MKRIAVFASGNGTNFENIINDKSINADWSILICDNKNAKAIDIAKNNNIETFAFSAKDYENKAHYEKEISTILDNLEIDLIVLAGYMRILSKEFVEKYEGKIINIHPSLLPLYKGGHAIEDAFNDGKNIFGATVHYVVAEIDSGEIIIQDTVNNTEGLTLNEITQKVHELEYILYPKAIKIVLNSK